MSMPMNEDGPSRYHYLPPAPDVLVAVFGLLVVVFDGDGLRIALLDPRTVRGGSE